MVQIRYEHDPVTTTTHELVQYSNEFIITRTAPISSTEIVVKVNQPQLNNFELENNSSVSLWLPSACSGVDVYDNDDGYSSLQRLTSEGTWEIYRPLKSNCTGNVEAIFLEPGHSILVDTIRWLSIDRDVIAPGIYRWDVVFYLEHVHPPSGLLRDIRHIFSETFEYTR